MTVVSGPGTRLQLVGIHPHRWAKSMAGPSLTAQIWVDVRTFDSSRWQAPAMAQRELGRFARAAVIITGGAHGIGRACAARLAEEGAHIVVADLDQTAAQQVASGLAPKDRSNVASGLAPKDRSHVPLWLDVTDASSVERAFAEAISGLSGIDVLIRTSPAATQITARSRRRPTRSGLDDRAQPSRCGPMLSGSDSLPAA